MTTDLDKWKSDWNRLTRQNAFGAVLSMTRQYTEDEFRESGRETWARIARHMPRDCSRIADIGCGAGRVLEFARQNCTTAIGIDISDEMLRIARERLGTDGYLFADSFDPIEPGSVDFIYTVGVFKHLTIEMVERHIRDGARALRPGGVYFISYYSKPPKDQASWIDETSPDREAQRARANRVIPEERMLAMLEGNGLRVLSTSDWQVVAERTAP